YTNPKNDLSKKVSIMNDSEEVAGKPKFLRYNTTFSRLLKLVLDMSEREQLRLLEYAKSIIDERTFPRNHCLIKANCTLKDRTFDGLILDLNQYGAYVDTNEPCTIGQEIYISFYNPFSYKNMNLGGKIVWSSSYGIGLRFNDLSRARYIW
ncbi:MAG: PilZ domain-containing protein, partial [Desulfobacteraceae bacterium]|nr:PilZ domain-containing protein [Desulfobacteraceae bacterium]